MLKRIDRSRMLEGYKLHEYIPNLLSMYTTTKAFQFHLQSLFLTQHGTLRLYTEREGGNLKGEKKHSKFFIRALAEDSRVKINITGNKLTHSLTQLPCALHSM